MRIIWRGLELPTRLEMDPEVSNETYGRFIAEPFERGFGTTIGNSLRRVLLSSLEGAAVTSVKIKGADHEFCSLTGVLEDVTNIILNVKKIIIVMDNDVPQTLTVKAKKAGEVTAGMIEGDSTVRIINPDQVIATLTEDVEFEMELNIEKGRGYSAARERIAEADRYEQEHGLIEIDAIYSPVVRVRYRTEDTRVGQRTNYDKLILEIWTDGSTSPDMALVESAKILRKHINPFVQFSDLGEETVEEEVVITDQKEEQEKMDEELRKKLEMSVNELDLSVRANNCLESIKVDTVGELVKLTEAELLKVRSFGKTSLREIQRKLEDYGLSLGMTDIDY
ncbi:DNA-directed RNA polymerase subunit alpha [Limihaloglobus sulfuriphilus]|uniref:DNA-directed RNA polymerase subunit alpha n=1 Tax=Limihaloglobus sulfuriphilus TaxID=1851148 RepID=A0A1Q2MH61_9BACT|nr:DNA-directed RNA polymerase subunit alpha [Limihaloglobus sulfuriphilus]AQQ72031.1 DNA-directed RNA polymerase subunit alpha [Limihaloglobus sulfuriphilus]